MQHSDALKVVLFALTGFGNPVLEALLADPRVAVGAVFTVKYDLPFPYYPERQLLDLCLERDIVCHHGVKVGSDEGLRLLRHYAPDLILVATFKQLLREPVLAIPRLGAINFHPSLLPAWRGPCPTNAALWNDAQVTGLSVHYVTPGVDEGNVLLQRAIPIGEMENDGQLRRRLAQLGGDLVPAAVDLFAGGGRPVGVPQVHSEASFAPKPVPEDGELEPAQGVDVIRRRMRAFNPLPGTSIVVDGARVAVDRYELFTDSRRNGLYPGDSAVDLVIDGRVIRLFRKSAG